MKGIAALIIAFVAVAHAANKCPIEQETDWSIELLLTHGDCDKFYKCTYGVPIEQNCPPGLFFNVELLQCDWKTNVDCSDRNVPGEETQPELKPQPEPETEDKPEPNPEPEDKPEPNPEPEDKPEPNPEPEDKPEPNPEPEQKPEPKPEPEQKPEQKPEPEAEEPEIEEVIPVEPELDIDEGSGDDEYPIDFQENGCPTNPYIHWLVPSSEDCSVFYQCVWGELVSKRCSASLHFNPVLQVCDWPNNAGCAVSHNKHDKSVYRK